MFAIAATLVAEIQVGSRGGSQRQTSEGIRNCDAVFLSPVPEQAKEREVEEKRLSLATNRHPDNVSVKHPAGTRSAHREMVRYYKALSNPSPSCYNLHKVKIHVRRLRSGNGGSSSCAGEQHPQLERPGPAGSAGGTPNRRTRFRYCSVFSALQEW